MPNRGLHLTENSAAFIGQGLGRHALECAAGVTPGVYRLIKALWQRSGC